MIYPGRVKMDYPTLLNDQAPSMFAYSIYSTVAEKMEAIVSLGVTNSRYKDFYDLCTIPEREDFDGAILREALVETFENRHTGFDVIAAFDEGFTDDYSRQQRWRGFLKNKNVTSERSFSEAINEVKHFLLPVIKAIRSGSPFQASWSHDSKSWN